MGWGWAVIFTWPLKVSSFMYVGTIKHKHWEWGLPHKPYSPIPEGIANVLNIQQILESLNKQTKLFYCGFHFTGLSELYFVLKTPVPKSGSFLISKRLFLRGILSKYFKFNIFYFI